MKADQPRLSHARSRPRCSRGDKSLLETTEAAPKQNNHCSKDGGIRKFEDEALSELRGDSFEGNLMPQRHRAEAGLRQPRKKSAQKDRRCRHCETQQSYQWRIGPDGPGKSTRSVCRDGKRDPNRLLPDLGTLCSSCGAKWTFQMKKNGKSLNRTQGDQSSNEPEILARAAKSDINVNGNGIEQQDSDIGRNG